MTKTLNGSIITVLTPKMQSWMLERLEDDIERLEDEIDPTDSQLNSDLAEYKALHSNVTSAQRHQ